MKTSCHALQHLIQVTLKCIVLLSSPRLIAWKIITLAVYVSGFKWVMLVVTSTSWTAIIAFLHSLYIVLVSTFPIISGVSAILRFLFLSQTLCSIAETWRSVVQVLFLLVQVPLLPFLKNNNCSGFHNIKLIQSKRQFPNLKKLLTKGEFGEVLSHMFNCSDKRYECCNYFLINDHYTFTNVQITFKLKNRFTCDSFNLIYVVIYDTFTEEYIGETWEGKTKLNDRVRVFHQHIRQPQCQQLKVEGHLRACGNGEFRIFSLLQMR